MNTADMELHLDPPAYNAEVLWRVDGQWTLMRLVGVEARRRHLRGYLLTWSSIRSDESECTYCSAIINDDEVLIVPLRDYDCLLAYDLSGRHRGYISRLQREALCRRRARALA